LLEATRDHIEHHYERSAWQNFLRHFAIEKVFPYPERMELALKPVSLLKKVAKFLPGFAREALSLIPDEMEPGALPPFSPAVGARRGRVGMVRGCVMSVMFDPTNVSTMKLLNRVGYDVVVPPQQGCCGALYAHGGNLRKARESAKRNIDAFQSADMVVINAAGCGSTLKEYGHLLADDENWQARGEQFGRKVKDITEVLGAFEWGDIGETRKVTYHDACHLAHAQRITKPPRVIIRSVVGKNFVELPESDVCCGSAGSYNLTEPDMAERLQRRKIENILKSGAEIVLTTNPGCLLQIRAGLKKAGAEHIRALHLVDYLIDAQPNRL
jgi:glycolate oxidase iron-sulfur subunit